jgi:hypothetical protein
MSSTPRVVPRSANEVVGLLLLGPLVVMVTTGAIIWRVGGRKSDVGRWAGSARRRRASGAGPSYSPY